VLDRLSIKNILLEMRWKRARVVTEWNGTMGCEMKWHKTGCCGLNICERIQLEQRNGMTALICGVELRSHLCRAVLRWVK
jgi:hypothetical protein